MENLKVKNALQKIYDSLEAAKESNIRGYAHLSTDNINNALSEVMVITEEMDIQITI